MNLFDSLISLVAPHDCIACTAEGALICTSCRGDLAHAFKRCYKCHEPSSLSATCRSCLRYSPLASVNASYRYENAAKDIVWKVKFDRARSAGREMADMCTVPDGLLDSNNVIVTHAPTATSRVRQRGYDQAEVMARALAARYRLPYRALLGRSGQRKQVGSSKLTRASQLEDAFHVRSHRYTRDARIILVDDVITTGATLEAAATALRGAGARRVDAVVFAQA